MKGEGRGEYRIGAVFSNREIIAGIVDSRHRVGSRASLARGAGCDYRETARLVADCAGLAFIGGGLLRNGLLGQRFIRTDCAG